MQEIPIPASGLGRKVAEQNRIAQFGDGVGHQNIGIGVRGVNHPDQMPVEPGTGIPKSAAEVGCLGSGPDHLAERLFPWVEIHLREEFCHLLKQVGCGSGGIGDLQMTKHRFRVFLCQRDCPGCAGSGSIEEAEEPPRKGKVFQSQRRHGALGRAQNGSIGRDHVSVTDGQKHTLVRNIDLSVFRPLGPGCLMKGLVKALDGLHPIAGVSDGLHLINQNRRFIPGIVSGAEHSAKPLQSLPGRSGRRFLGQAALLR